MIAIDSYTESTIQKTLSALSGLVIYSSLKEDPFLCGLRCLLSDMSRVLLQDSTASTPSTADRNAPHIISPWTEQYAELYGLLLQNNLTCIPDLHEYVIALAQNDDNAFARIASGHSSGTSETAIDSAMRLCVLGDLERILIISSFPSRVITGILSDKGTVPLPEWRHNSTKQTPALLYQSLVTYHSEKSFGVFSHYHAFIWKDHKLSPVEKPDPILPDQLFSYEYEIGQVRENTMRLLRHKRADNLLLFGARGTGKSSTVKAMANQYRNQGLRIIEVNKDDLLTIADLLSYLSELSDVRLSFILFLDDLSFAEEDSRYMTLKTLLEGGIKTRPENVAIYATSNRGHIVAEKESNEMYANDAKDEKLSLSDRFGISIRFASPNQQIYLTIVYGILTDRKVTFDREIVAQKALTWAMRENFRSPRTARQFADYYESSES